jgi:hypothetical protein
MTISLDQTAIFTLLLGWTSSIEARWLPCLSGGRGSSSMTMETKNWKAEQTVVNQVCLLTGSVLNTLTSVRDSVTKTVNLL